MDKKSPQKGGFNVEHPMHRYVVHNLNIPTYFYYSGSASPTYNKSWYYGLLGSYSLKKEWPYDWSGS